MFGHKKLIFLLLALSNFHVAPAMAVASSITSTVFPPTNCVNGQTMYMGWDGVNSTTCNTGQDVLKNALNCTAQQMIAFDGSQYYCKTIPTCGADESLTFDGTDFHCVQTQTKLPTCTAGQTLTSDGTNWVCQDANTAQLGSWCGVNRHYTMMGPINFVIPCNGSVPYNASDLPTPGGACPAGYTLYTDSYSGSDNFSTCIRTSNTVGK